jgi:hypothetical protein
MRAHGGLVRVVVLVGATLLLASCQLGLGGPNNEFGNDLPDGCLSLTSTVAPCPNPNIQPGVWAAIQGPFSRHRDGDPFATMCSGDNVTRSTCDPNWPTGGAPNPAATSVQNTRYHAGGYSWAVDVPQADVGAEITVEIYDPADGGTGAPLNELLDANGGTFTTSYELFAPSGSPIVKETPDLSMAGHCDAGDGQHTFASGTSTGAPYYTEQWYTLCRFVPTQAGIYPLQVKTSDIPGVLDAGTGWNAYSVKAVTSVPSTEPGVYALSNLSMSIDTPGTANQLYLANVGAQDAGKTMHVEMYDPGDGVGPNAFTLQVLAPPSGLGRIPFGGSTVPCNYNATPSGTEGPATPDVSSNCTVTTKLAGSSTGVYDSAWLRLSIVIPTSYTCTTDCWWSVRVNLGTGASTPADRTTWSVDVS